MLFQIGFFFFYFGIVHRNKTKFWVLIFYPVILLNSFTSFNKFVYVCVYVCVESLGVSTYKTNRWFYLFLYNLDTFYFFSLPNCPG